VKSTASQQQDTMSDMNSPKSWTAGIWSQEVGQDVVLVSLCAPVAPATPDQGPGCPVQEDTRSQGFVLGTAVEEAPTLSKS
jgi:hypothetical protein